MMKQTSADFLCQRCGNPFHVECLTKDPDEWQRRAVRAHTICPFCRKEQERNERACALPHLTGSAKQISWAEKIRKNFLDAPEVFPFDAKKMIIEEFDDASWWIINRRRMRTDRELVDVIKAGAGCNEFYLAVWRRLKQIDGIGRKKKRNHKEK